MRVTLLKILFVIGGFLFIPAWSASPLRIHFISVGHGDAMLLERDGQALALVDAGLPEAGPTIYKYIKDLGMTRIEHFFITHTHRDHLGGAPLILDSLQVGTIHHTGMQENKEPFRVFERYLLKDQWEIDTTDRGETPIQIADLTVEVLSPLSAEVTGEFVSPNNHSLVLLVRHGEIQFLLAADIDSDRETWLLEQDSIRLQSQVLKASHHASDLGCSQPFLDTVKPQIVIVTVGPNQYGYPSEKTLQRLTTTGAVVLRTDNAGTVVLESNGTYVTVLVPSGMKP